MQIQLMPHQKQILEQTKSFNRTAHYLEMGTGKTFTGSEKMNELDANTNIIVCQKSKVNDWLEHFITFYTNLSIFDLTNAKSFNAYIEAIRQKDKKVVGIINYDLIFRRPMLRNLRNYTLLLDESSLIQNETSKRANFILRYMNPNAKNVILLSGTPTGGKYEKLWSQCRLLGWDISKKAFYDRYIIEEDLCNWAGLKILTPYGTPIKKVVGYKNVNELKEQLRLHGAVFLKSDEVIDLPKQTFIKANIPTSTAYKRFKKDKIIEIEGKTLVGDTSLTQLLYLRELCGMYNKDKIDYLKDLIMSTEDRMIVFYNFNDELKVIEDTCLKLDRPLSIINGFTKDLSLYDEYDNSVTAVQYQAGAMGLNLQKANKIIYFTPPLSSELYEQSKKRIHRIGQEKPCFYYQLTSGIEKDIYETLEMRKDYTDKLFEEQNNIRKIILK